MYCSPSACPVCDEYYNAALSGNVDLNQETTIDANSITSICVVGPSKKADPATLYFHTTHEANDDSK